jgi:hypothetical protein
MEQIKCNKCGAVDKFYTEVKANNNVARCSECDAFIKNIPYEQPKFYVGKYKDKLISEIEDMNYLKWALKEMKLSKSMTEAISNRISHFEYLAK